MGIKTPGVWLVAAMAATGVGLAGCDGGAAEVASPGVGAFPPAPPPPPPPPPPPLPGETVPAASGSCPSGTLESGTITVPGGSQLVCAVQGTITGTLNIPRIPGVLYSINGRVSVGNDVGGAGDRPGGAPGQLNIAPGVTLFGSSGGDFIVVQRGSQIQANGTLEAPIVFTGRDDILGNDQRDRIGQFGGLVILGRAPVNSCPATIEGGTVNCEAQVEGTNAFYGGATVNDNSGSLFYVQVRYAGFEIAPNNELNGITLAGVGSGTRVENVQVHNGSDDGVEFFGGRVNVRNLVVTGADDDSIDWDSGWQGGIQFALVVQRATTTGTNNGDRVIEGSSGSSNNDRLPRTLGSVANFTFIANAGTGEAVILNQGTDANLVNGIITGKSFCLDVDNNATATAAPTFNSVAFACAAAVRDEADVPASIINGFISAGANNRNPFTTSFLNGFVNGPNETGVPVSNAATITGSTFFQTTTYIGAVQNAADRRFRQWTCGLYTGELTDRAC